ncbi:MAG TPA: HAD family phosphatase [Aggregatilineales bacterium]|nr:HAD family phosphatase [Aggregatilineales bacterium]
MKPALIFDFGGVFMKTTDHSPRHRWDDRLGLAHGSIEKVVHGSESWRAAQTGVITPDVYRADIAAQLGLAEDDMADLFRDYFSGDQLDQSLVEYAATLHKRGYQVALLSNDSLELAPKLSALGISQLFDPLVISAHIGVMKPDERAYRAVLDKIGRKPAEAIFIDDMPANIAGAEAIGIKGILYTNTAALEQDLEALLTRT